MTMKIISILRVQYFVILSLAYTLGAGLACYLGENIDMSVFLLGYTSLLPLFISTFLLQIYFQSFERSSTLDPDPARLVVVRRSLLQFSFACLTVSALLTTLLVLAGAIRTQAGILLVVLVLFLIVYAIPPFAAYKKGFGEVLLALSLANLIPIYTYLLFGNDYHKIVPLVTLPLACLAIAWLLAENFSTYSLDMTNKRLSLLIWLTWERGVQVHHIILFLALLILLALPLIGVPWTLLWSLALVLPLYLAQIYWLQRIVSGRKPAWKAFIALVSSTFSLVLYLLSLSFWIR
jgi:1,4-dihydroxy-2-naphthoate octaprenyltransferase